MKTICVTSLKGGSGKTTVAVNLAVEFSRRGKRTLLVDTDPNRSAFLSLNSGSDRGPDLRAISAGALFQDGLRAQREGYEIRIIDSPAAPKSDVAAVMNSSELCVVVSRPTYLDLAAAVETARLTRQLSKPAIVVLNQAQVARGEHHAPAVRRAIEAVRLTDLPLAGVLTARLSYQTSLSSSRGAGELDPAKAGAELEELVGNVLSQLAENGGTPMVALKAI